MKSLSSLVGRHGFTARLLTGTVLLVLLVVALAVLVSWEDRLEHERRAHTNVHNISLLLERDISAVFERVDLTLRTVAEEAQRQLAAGGLDEARFNAFLLQQETHLPEITSLRLADAQGIARLGKDVVPDSVVDISDREHFILQRGNPKAGLVIAAPVVGRLSKQWSIPVSRRVNRPDGEFAGIVYLGIPVSNFTRNFAELDLGVHGIVALRSETHRTVARYPVAQEGGGVPGQFALSDQLRKLLQDNPRHFTYVAPSPVDQIERVFAYTRLTTYPLYVVVGIATQDYLNDWWRDTIQTFAVVLLFCLATWVFVWLLLRFWHRQQASSEALRHSEQRWSFALEGGGFSVWDWDLQTGQVLQAKRGKALFGFDDDEIGDHIADWAPRCHPDDVAGVVERMKDHFRHRAALLETEFRVRCKDGSWKWVHTRGMVVKRAPDGKPLRMIGTHVDISERRRREEELSLASAVFRMANEAMVITSSGNLIVSVNPAFTVITGYEPEEVIGKNPNLLSAKSHPKAFYQEMWKILNEKGAWAGEVLNRKKSGEVYVEWLSIRRVLNEARELTNYVAVFSDITERKAAEKRMRHLALHDALTDLPNRTLLAERLEQAIVRAQRDKSHTGLIYFDLDRFKPVNDAYGHEVGDLLLKAVAERVRGCVRASDTVARLGGDEFVVLLPVVEGDKEAMLVAEKIRQELTRSFDVAGQMLEIGSSLGVAVYPIHGVDAAMLMRHADAAMYEAKKTGRNQALLFHPGM